MPQYFSHRLLVPSILLALLIRDFTETDILIHDVPFSSPPAYCYLEVNAALPSIEVGQVQNIRYILLRACIDHIQLRLWDGDRPGAIQIQLVVLYILLVGFSQVHQHPQTDVDGKGGLRFCQDEQFIPYLKPQVVIRANGEDIL